MPDPAKSQRMLQFSQRRLKSGMLFSIVDLLLVVQIKTQTRKPVKILIDVSLYIWQ
jgi:hypothetical protein